MRWLAVVVLLPALAFPAVADAQSSEILQVLSPDGGRAWSVPLQVSGVVSVDFHGDRGAGCEQAGLCDVSGNETWDPGSRGELLAFGRKRPEGALLVFGADPISDGGSTTARVERTGPDGSTHTCADVASARGGGDLQASHGGFDVRLTGTGGDPFSDASLLGTRCAGPVDADVRDLLPAGHLSAEQLAMGNARVDLTGERSFASHGLAGTVQSTVVLTLGASVRQHQGKQPPSAVRHVKLVTVTYAIESARGQVSARFAACRSPSSASSSTRVAWSRRPPFRSTPRAGAQTSRRSARRASRGASFLRGSDSSGRLVHQSSRVSAAGSGEAARPSRRRRRARAWVRAMTRLRCPPADSSSRRLGSGWWRGTRWASTAPRAASPPAVRARRSRT